MFVPHLTARLTGAIAGQAVAIRGFGRTVCGTDGGQVHSLMMGSS